MLRKINLVILFNLLTLFLTAQIVAKIDQKLKISDRTKKLEIVVILKDQADISHVKNIKGKDTKATFVYQSLTKKAEQGQQEIIEFLHQRGISFQSYYIVNMVTLQADWDLITAIASLNSVSSVIEDGNFVMQTPITDKKENGSRSIEWNISHINAPAVWNMGFNGQGVVIGGQDTGYEWNDPVLINKYRGWNGITANHNYNWHDAIDSTHAFNTGINPCGYQLSTPCDDNNHGTHTMGTMIGDDGLGNQTGVAPGATWIGCRNMERGWGTLSSYVECFQWFLAPYPIAGGAGDPSKMPHVINNSWGCPPSEGCNTTNFSVMEMALNNLRNAGCVIVVSAGNAGSSCSTVNDPAAIFSGSFSVGATNNTDAIAGFSSRGPVTVDGSNRLKPNISAPGVSIRSCIKGTNAFASFNGTSMAGPHVAGLVALLISANPELAGEVDKIEDIIEQTAVPKTTIENCGSVLGTSIPNNTFGYGRIDALAAVNRALNQLYVPTIKIDQFGYRPNDEKIAILSDPQLGYNSTDSYTPSPTIVVKNSSTFQVVFSGSPVVWNSGSTHSQSGDRVWRFDFSSLTTQGIYHIADGNSGGIRSEDFVINQGIYDDVLKTAFNTFYYQRCGIAKIAPFANTGYIDAACHTQDLNCRYISDPNNISLHKNLTGGWHDAGDYNKYVNFAYKPVSDLLWSYEINPQAWVSDEMNIPESNNGIPDLLDEIKYELDWMTKMQDTDGGVFCVVGVQNHLSASPPSADNAVRYYGPKSTAASLTAAASFAFAAKQFRKIDNPTAQTYATTLQNKAIQAWTWANDNPSVTYYNASNNLAAGEQEVDNYERDMRKLAAAVYLYDITNDNTYRIYVENNYSTSHLMQWNFVYPFENVIQLSLLHFSHLNGVNPVVANNIKNAFRNSMQNSSGNFPAQMNDLDAYKAYIETQNIGWGSNHTKCNHGNLYQVYHHFNLNSSNNSLAEKTMSHYVHYMHGVNPNGLTYLTNMQSLGSDRSVNTIYHSWFNNGSTLWDDVRTSTYGPAPGFMPGGPNPGWSLDGCCPSGCGSTQNNNLCVTINPPVGNQPALKAYNDWNTGWPQNSWSVTENAIYYQSAYLLLLSSMVNQTTTIISPIMQITTDNDLYISSLGKSVILTSPNNSKYKMNVSNTGLISTLPVSVSGSSSKLSNSSLNINASEKGIITKSPNNTIWRISIGKAGELKTTSLGTVTGNYSEQQSGDFSIEDTPNSLILKDENNICYIISVNDSGTIFTKPTSCNN